MMKKIYILFILIITFYSCKNSEELCINNYFELSKHIYDNSFDNIDNFKNGCLNTDTPYENRKIIEEVIKTSKIDKFKHYTSMRISVNSNSEDFICVSQSEKMINYKLWQPIYKQQIDTLVYQVFTYEYIDADSKTMSGFGISIFSSDYEGSSYKINCQNFCDFSIAIFFDEIPNCFCNWFNSLPSEHKIETPEIKGKMSYLNKCFD